AVPVEDVSARTLTRRGECLPDDLVPRIEALCSGELTPRLCFSARGEVREAEAIVKRGCARLLPDGAPKRRKRLRRCRRNRCFGEERVDRERIEPARPPKVGGRARGMR